MLPFLDAILGTGGLGAGGGGTVSTPQKGGRAGKFPSMPSFAHFGNKALSLFTGGRPAGVHPKDTVATWLDPKEYVITGKVVKALGQRFFDLINFGGLDPITAALSSAAGGRRNVRRSRTGELSMASGGPVPVSSRAPGRGNTTIINALFEEDILGALAGAQGQQVVLNHIRVLSSEGQLS